MKKRKFKYLLLLYVGGDGPFKEVWFYTDAPVNIGHEIEWLYNPEDKEAEIHLKVTGISHYSDGVTLYCEYDDGYIGDYSIATLIELGVPKEYAKEVLQRYREICEGKRKLGDFSPVISA